MPFCLLFLTAGMLSLRSGLFLLGQAKRKSTSAAVSRGKTEPGQENSNCIKIPACAGMTDLLMEQRLFTTPAPPKSGGEFPS